MDTPGSSNTPAPVAAKSPEILRDRADRTIGGLCRLFEKRPDLRGVFAPADLTDDALRWSA